MNHDEEILFCENRTEFISTDDFACSPKMSQKERCVSIVGTWISGPLTFCELGRNI